MQPHTELCAFVCTPDSKKGKPLSVNCQLLTDSELIRLAVELEDHDFQCKVSYDLTNKMDVDDWWVGKREDLKEWMADMGVADFSEVVAECMMKMLVPIKSKTKGGGLVPVERKPVQATKPSAPEPALAKPKRVKRDDDEPQLF